MLLAATLTLGFTACGDDEKEEPQPQPEPQPEVIAFEDYSSTIGMSLNAMLQKYGEPTYNFGSYYAYEYETGNVTNLTIAVNPDNNLVYTILESLKEDAYTAEDIRAYFASKYYFYEKEEYPADEEEGTPASETYVYGNTENPDEATLVISVADNYMVGYSNPQNMPAESPVGSFDEMTPLEVLASFLGQSKADILDEYGDSFTEMGGMYITAITDNDYLTGFAITAPEDVVTVITYFFDDGLEEEAIFEYFRAGGYEVIETGVVDEEGFKQYLITNGVIDIVYQGYMAVALFGEED